MIEASEPVFQSPLLVTEREDVVFNALPLAFVLLLQLVVLPSGKREISEEDSDE